MQPDLPVPTGFRIARIGGDFVSFNGPLYGKWTPDELLLGFRVQSRHTNPLGVCHGGMLATFADMLVPMTAIYRRGQERRFLPTISLQIDYLGPAPLGLGAGSGAGAAQHAQSAVWSGTGERRRCTSTAFQRHLQAGPAVWRPGQRRSAGVAIGQSCRCLRPRTGGGAASRARTASAGKRRRRRGRWRSRPNRPTIVRQTGWRAASPRR